MLSYSTFQISHFKYHNPVFQISNIKYHISQSSTYNQHILYNPLYYNYTISFWSSHLNIIYILSYFLYHIWSHKHIYIIQYISFISLSLYQFILHNNILYYTIYFTTIYYTTLYHTTLYRTTIHRTILYHTIQYTIYYNYHMLILIYIIYTWYCIHLSYYIIYSNNYHIPTI